MGVAGFQSLCVRVGMAQPRVVFTENRKGLSEGGGRGGGGRRGQSDGPSAPAHHSVQPQCLDGKEVCVWCVCVVCVLAEISSVFHDSLSGY